MINPAATMGQLNLNTERGMTSKRTSMNTSEIKAGVRQWPQLTLRNMVRRKVYLWTSQIVMTYIFLDKAHGRNMVSANVHGQY